MSPEELAELEKTDLLLARTVRDPEARKSMELFLSLPAEEMEKFLATGRLYMSLGACPYRFQAASQERLQSGLSDALAEHSQYMTNFFTALLDEGTTVQISYEESGDFGDGVGGGISGDDKAGRSFRMGGLSAIPPSLPSQWEGAAVS